MMGVFWGSRRPPRDQSKGKVCIRGLSCAQVEVCLHNREASILKIATSCKEQGKPLSVVSRCTLVLIRTTTVRRQMHIVVFTQRANLTALATRRISACAVGGN